MICDGDLHGVRFVKFALVSQVSEQFPASDVGHQKVKVARVLREALQANLFKEFRSFGAYQKGVIDLRKDVVLRDNVVHLSQLDDVSLLQALHR